MSSASQTPRRARRPAPGLPQGGDVVRVYVWDFVVRATHWAIVFSILVLTVTGVFIGDPYLVAPGEASAHTHMTTMKVIHFGASIVFTLAVLTRLVWMFVGSRWARWSQFVPVDKARRKGLWETFLFYMLIRRKPPPAVGHNPLAGLFYVIVFGLYLGMILTGLAMYSVSHPETVTRPFAMLLPLLGGAQMVRFIHHLGMWLLLGFFAQHIASAVLMSISEKNGLLGSMFAGHKWLRKSHLKELGEAPPEQEPSLDHDADALEDSPDA